MTNWYVKELSKLTNLSVQTLHHYDRIDLLKPSNRMSNGYRVYSERDLLRLQQIVALKFFGFELSKIKEILSGKLDAKEHLKAQSLLLDKQVKNMEVASKALSKVLEDVKINKDLDWHKIIELIEVFNMTTELKYKYAAEVFSPEELKEYAKLEADLGAGRAGEREEFIANWKKLVQEVTENIHQVPDSPVAFRLAGRAARLVNGLYGKENLHLKNIKWEKGFKQGKFHDNEGLTPEIIEWLDKATAEHYKKRIKSILENASFERDKNLQMELNEIFEEMFGTSEKQTLEFVRYLLAHEEVSANVKSWLKKNYL